MDLKRDSINNVIKMDVKQENRRKTSSKPRRIRQKHGQHSLLQMLKRSPAEGKGARPPVTSGRRDTSGKFSMWDLTSAFTANIFCSFMLYS